MVACLDATASMYELIKSLSQLVYPLGSAIFIGCLALSLIFVGRRRSGLIIGAMALGWLWFCSAPVTADMLANSLERRYTYLSIADVPRADAAVILGGGAFNFDRNRPYASIGGTVDRYIHGARLFEARRVQKIVLTGARDQGEGPTEAQLGAAFLTEIGIPPEHVILENAARTTMGHVDPIAELLADRGLETFLLVTSAMHMRRAEAVFRAAGLKPVPIATDFRVNTVTKMSIRRLLPSLSALSLSTVAIHEYIGFSYYRIRGWV